MESSQKSRGTTDGNSKTSRKSVVVGGFKPRSMALGVGILGLAGTLLSGLADEEEVLGTTMVEFHVVEFGRHCLVSHCWPLGLLTSLCRWKLKALNHASSRLKQWQLAIVFMVLYNSVFIPLNISMSTQEVRHARTI